MFDADSRYHHLEDAEHVRPDGTVAIYKRRRFLPQGRAMRELGRAAIVQGDRLDLVTARTLGRPEHFWRVADANDAMRPEELVDEVGRTLRIPVPEA